MKFVEIDFEVTDDGVLTTYRTSEVSSEDHEDLERALVQLEEMLVTVLEHRLIRPGLQRNADQQWYQGLGHQHD